MANSSETIASTDINFDVQTKNLAHFGCCNGFHAVHLIFWSRHAIHKHKTIPDSADPVDKVQPFSHGVRKTPGIPVLRPLKFFVFIIVFSCKDEEVYSMVLCVGSCLSWKPTNWNGNFTANLTRYRHQECCTERTTRRYNPFASREFFRSRQLWFGSVYTWSNHSRARNFNKDHLFRSVFSSSGSFHSRIRPPESVFLSALCQDQRHRNRSPRLCHYSGLCLHRRHAGRNFRRRRPYPRRRLCPYLDCTLFLMCLRRRPRARRRHTRCT